MQLHKLHIEKYQNLSDFTLEFKSPLTILAGNNGSGKSNLLEALSGIFRNAYKTPYNPACDYSLSYELDSSEVYSLKMDSGRPSFTKRTDKDPQGVNVEGQNRAGALPYLIAIYSGEESRLWQKFYRQDVSSDTRRRFWYLNRDYWMAALLTLVLSPEIRKNNSLQSLLQVDLENDDDIKIQLDLQTLTNPNKSALVNALSRLHSVKEGKPSVSVSEFRDAFTDENGKKLFRNNIDLFHALYEASQGRRPIISDILIPVKETGNVKASQEKVSLAGLSEGEKKMILVGTILELFSDGHTLLLLDEPDAHIHESRKHELLTFLCQHKECQIVMTTHSIELARNAVNEKKGQVVLLTPNGPFDDFSVPATPPLDADFWKVLWNDTRAVVIFEGPTDVMYVEWANEQQGFPLNGYLHSVAIKPYVLP